jgi:hypothetical protein
LRRAAAEFGAVPADDLADRHGDVRGRAEPLQRVQIGGRKPSICELGGLPLGRHVLNQPALPKPEWEAEVDKMRTAFKAPIDAKDVGAILDYLVSIKGVN